MTLPAIDWLAILVCVIAAMALGFAWYAPPVFMRPWLRGIEKTKEQLGKPGPAMALTLVMAAVSAIGIALVYGWMGRGGVGPGLLAGLVVWLTGALPVAVNNVAFENRPWILLPVSAGFYLASFLAMGLIVGLFG